MYQQNIGLLIDELNSTNKFGAMANDPLLQFELDGQKLLFSSLLPERNVESNSYRDSGVRFKTMVANDSTRYSPPQKKGAMLVSSVAVELGESDIAGELTQEAYEAFLKYLNRDLSQQAIAQVLRFFENSISAPLAMLREKHRAEALLNGTVVRRGANRYEEVVTFPNPAGHRASVVGVSDPAFSILTVMKQKRLMLQTKGYQVNRLIMSEDTFNRYFVNNTEIKQYGVMSVQAPGSNQAFTLPTSSQYQTVYNAFSANQLPQPEFYNHGYSDENGWQPFVTNQILMVCTTGRAAEVEIGKNTTPIILPNTLGYTGIGIATGQLTPGVATKVEPFTGKDARIEASGWQTSFPVIQDPEAFVVLSLLD